MNNTLTGIELVKELNSKITKGKLNFNTWGTLSHETNFNSLGYDAQIEVNRLGNLDEMEATANKDYIKLSFENFGSVVDALQMLLKEARANSFNLHHNINDTPAEAMAQQALNNIKL